MREVALSASMCFTLLAAKTISSISGKPEQRLEKAWKCIYIYFSNSMEIIQKEYFLRIFQSVFFVLPIMQYNVLLKIPSLALLVMQT